MLKCLCPFPYVCRKRYVACHIAKCQGKKKSCAHPGHGCWLLKKVDIRQKFEYARRKRQKAKDLLGNTPGLQRPTYPLSTMLRGLSQPRRGNTKRQRPQSDEESDDPGDGHEMAAGFVEMEAEEEAEVVRPNLAATEVRRKEPSVSWKDREKEAGFRGSSYTTLLKVNTSAFVHSHSFDTSPISYILAPPPTIRKGWSVDMSRPHPMSLPHWKMS